MEIKKIAVIGAGNIGSAIAEGILEAKLIKPENLAATSLKLELIEHLKAKGATTTTDNIEAATDADIVFLAIKPAQTKQMLLTLKPILKPNQAIVSIVTGYTIEQIANVIGEEVAIFRAMPNTAISIRESMTCIAHGKATEDQVNTITEIFDNMGKALVINENLMPAATVMASAGIAFAFRFIRAAMQGGIEIGFGSQVAKLIAAQTAKGAAALLEDPDSHPEKEIDKVTTPQGITINAINTMEHSGFSSALIKGVVASHQKIEQVKKRIEEHENK